MNIHDKFMLISKAISGETQIEMYCRDTWNIMTYDGRLFGDENGDFFRISELLDRYEIRATRKLPLLTDEECEFLKHFREYYYVAKDKDGTIRVWEIKPKRTVGCWSFNMGNEDDYSNMEVCGFDFEGIKWSDEDCYTIGELIENAKKVRQVE
jgi:hypothetical protein